VEVHRHPASRQQQLCPIIRILTVTRPGASFVSESLPGFSHLLVLHIDNICESGYIVSSLRFAGIACTIGSERLVISKDLMHQTAKIPMQRMNFAAKKDLWRRLHVLLRVSCPCGLLELEPWRLISRFETGSFAPTATQSEHLHSYTD
jgi:hypothetical protein